MQEAIDYPGSKLEAFIDAGCEPGSTQACIPEGHGDDQPDF